jgi:glycerol kinase
MLLDLAAGAWDDELLELFGVDRAVLPEVVRTRVGVAGRSRRHGRPGP